MTAGNRAGAAGNAAPPAPSEGARNKPASFCRAVLAGAALALLALLPAASAGFTCAVDAPGGAEAGGDAMLYSMFRETGCNQTAAWLKGNGYFAQWRIEPTAGAQEAADLCSRTLAGTATAGEQAACSVVRARVSWGSHPRCCHH